MNIGIVGAENVRTGLAKRLIAHGHSVMLSFSRSDDALRIAAAALGARSGTPSEAAQFGHVVILSLGKGRQGNPSFRGATPLTTRPRRRHSPCGTGAMAGLASVMKLN